MDIILKRTTLIPPKNINITYTNPQHNIMLTWDMVEYNGFDIYYNIYKSTISNGVFIKLNKEPVKGNRFVDYSVRQNMNVTYWYKISTCYIYNNEVIESDLSNAFIYKVDNTNKWFHKMNERDMWILKMDGELFDLYKRKLEGEHCSCWDDERGSASNPNCDICYGTGFVGGYDPVYQLYIRQKPANNNLSREGRGLTVKNSTGAWTICDIQIRDRDLLINPQGIMFRVTTANVNHAAGYLFHQELAMEEVETNDPIYKLKRQTLKPFY